MNKRKRYNNASGYHYLYDTAQWKRLRKLLFSHSPLCVMCLQQGITTNATVADHITPHNGNIELFYDYNNLQALCKAHHDCAKQLLEIHGISIGSDVTGAPLDQAHHWNK